AKDFAEESLSSLAPSGHARKFVGEIEPRFRNHQEALFVVIVACSFSQIEKRGRVPSVLVFLTHSSPEPRWCGHPFRMARKTGCSANATRRPRFGSYLKIRKMCSFQHARLSRAGASLGAAYGVSESSLGMAVLAACWAKRDQSSAICSKTE